MPSRKPEEIAQAIRQADTIAICSHVSPDGDTLGCAAAMRMGLISLGKKVSVFCDDKVPDNLSFLPGADTFRPACEQDGPFDLMLAVDVSDEGRLGKSICLKQRSRHTAQIDHHPTNPEYMEVNSVDGNAPAACVLVREQLRALGVELTREIAVCLYTGISTDTGNFSFSATNAECFDIMSELLRHQLPLAELSRTLFRERSREQLLLLGKAISGMSFHGGGQIAVMKLSYQDFLDCGAMSEHADTLVNFGLETVGTRMAILARETENGTIKFSLRAKSPGRVDDIAQMFGGGGHPQASGLTLEGPLDRAVAPVLEAMEKKLNEQES